MTGPDPEREPARVVAVELLGHAQRGQERERLEQLVDGVSERALVLFADRVGQGVLVPELTEAAQISVNLKDVEWRPALQSILDTVDWPQQHICHVKALHHSHPPHL